MKYFTNYKDSDSCIINLIDSLDGMTRFRLDYKEIYKISKYIQMEIENNNLCDIKEIEPEVEYLRIK